MSFQNTFAPFVENQELTADNIVKLLFLGYVKYEDIPDYIRPFVDEKMKQQDNPLELEPEPTQEARPPLKQFSTGKSHNIPTYIDKALDDYLKKKQSPNEDYEHLNQMIEAIVETEEGHWVTVKGHHILIKPGQSLSDAMKDQDNDKEKPITVGDKSLIKPEKKSLFKRPKKSAFQKGDVPAAEGRDFEPIIKSSAPTAEHMQSARQAFEAHPEVFAHRKDFLVHQAWAADQLRAMHEPVAKELRSELESFFPSTTVTYRVKKRYNMLEKLGRKPDKYKQVNELNDISGVMAICPDGISQMNAVKDHLAKTRDILETENYVEQPGNFGYRAIQLLVKDRKTGIVSEVQIKTPRESKWSIWAHDVYKPPTRRFADVIKQNKHVFEEYGKQMSDYYYKLDSDGTNLQKPDCPEIVHEHYECLE